MDTYKVSAPGLDKKGREGDALPDRELPAHDRQTVRRHYLTMTVGDSEPREAAALRTVSAS